MDIDELIRNRTSNKTAIFKSNEIQLFSSPKNISMAL